MKIYKILTSDQWAAFMATGESAGAPVDLSDGFIHFSTATQVRETAAKHFAGQTSLELLAFETTVFGGGLKWEPSRGGALFPHLYGAPLRLADVLWHVALPVENGVHVFPDDLE